MLAQARSSFHYLYFVLAAIDIITVSGSLFLSHIILERFERSVTSSQDWVLTLDRYEELSQLAGQVNAPGNDVFDSRDWRAERVRMLEAKERFQRHWDQLLLEARGLDASVSGPIMEWLNRVDHASARMIEEAESIFSDFKAGDERRAGSRMATMDRKYGELNSALYGLRKRGLEFNRSELEANLAHAKSLRYWEYIIAGVILLMVVTVLVYGHSLKRRFDRAEELIRNQQAHIEHSARMSSLGEMAAGIAHEINNPLAVIKGRSDQLQELVNSKKISNERIEKAAVQISSMSDRISQIVKSLRSMARNSEGDPFSTITVGEILRDVMALCQLRFEKNGTELVIESHGLEARDLECRPAQIGQILVNLLNNAFDAVKNQDDKKIGLEVRDLGDSVAFRVWDSGQGIPSNLREKIMQPFFTTKDVGEGTGLGLSISQGIAKDHAGELRLESAGSPTAFVLIMPWRQSTMREAQHA